MDENTAIPPEEQENTVPEQANSSEESTEQSPSAEEPPEAPAGKPWGFWITAGFGAVIALTNILITAIVIAVLIIVLAMMDVPHPDEKVGEWIETSGLLMAVLNLVSAVPTVVLCVLFAKLRRELPLSKYLALRPIALPEAVKWSIGITLFVLAEAAFSALLHIPPSDWMVRMNSNILVIPLVWQAVMVIAPVVEEVFFRGFLFKGLLETRRLGPVWTVVITAGLWACLHSQYEPAVILMIFVCGLYLGYARIRTNSLLIVILMHGVMNTLATVALLIELLLPS